MLTQEDYALLVNRYVRKDDCNERHTIETNKITELTVAQAKMNTQLGLLIKISSVTLGTIITAIIGAVMGMILK